MVQEETNSRLNVTPTLYGWDKALIKFLALFMFTVGALLGTVLFLTAGNVAPYAQDQNLHLLEEDELLVVNRLSEVYVSELKLRHNLLAPAPVAGVFGSHAIAGFSAKSLGKKSNQFFNYGVTHVGLPEVRAVMAYLKSQNKLPTEDLFVALHNPHTANFDHITQFVMEIPAKVILLHGGERLTKNIRRGLKHWGSQIRNRLDWRNLVYALAGECAPSYGAVSLREAAIIRAVNENDVGFVTRAVNFIKGTPSAESCPPLSGIRPDGRDIRQLTPPKDLMVKKSEPISPVPIYGGKYQILYLMQEIRKLAGDAKKIVFFVPPIFEHPRESAQSKLMDEVVLAAKAQNFAIIDDRRTSFDRSYYYNFMHPNERYFKDLAGRVSKLP